MHLLEAYLKEMLRIRAIGEATEETSYYPAIEKLLNEAGKDLKPKVRCVLQLKNRGAGHPDGGLFSQDQWQGLDEDDPLGNQAPSRGVLEVKGLGVGTALTIESKQVAGYWKKYRKVLVTNYRDFVLVGEDLEGHQAPLERFLLANSEEAFWDLASHPRKAAKERGDEFLEYLKRVILIGARIADPQDLAWLLASYARQALRRIQGSDLPALATIRKALEEALGMTFSGDKGEHFFESTFVQTLFYGVFSAWVLWARQQKPTDTRAKFDWLHAATYLRVPIIRKLFHEATEPGQLRDLGLAEILQWAAAVLNRVDRPTFFAAFREEHAVQYFYEPFLQAYDPVLRKDLGVWYTPEEIVKYQVARVDTVLREELDIADGLADPNVYVLDPCCGTGAYLVEVLRTIHATLKAKGDDALLAQDLKRAAMDRVFGFEILPAPFVISHLQLGLLLHDLGAPLANRTERVAVYLTNALTGWEPPKGAKQRLMFPELEEERDAADRVKRNVPILVILGNPPYNAFAGTSPEEEQGLVEPYKENLNKAVKDGGWGIKKFNLDDLYIRFFRVAERRIVEGTPGHGIVCYITNFSYIAEPSFVVMRKRFLEEFDQLWFDCMNGDSRETGKTTPDGKPDPSVFSTERNKAGIRVGTGIGLLVRKPERRSGPAVFFRHFWGVTKRSELLASLNHPNLAGDYSRVSPRASNRFSFRPFTIDDDYYGWPRVLDLTAVRPSHGLMEKRGNTLIDIDRQALSDWMKRYYDPCVAWDELAADGTGLTRNAARFDARKTRAKVLAREAFEPANLRRYLFRPLDTRWCYYSSVRPLWNEPRPALWAEAWAGNCFFQTRLLSATTREGAPSSFARVLSDDHLMLPDCSSFPFLLKATEKEGSHYRNTPTMFRELAAAQTRANLSPEARKYVLSLGISEASLDTNRQSAGLIWMHALSLTYAPKYQCENADGFRRDYPRIPLPASREALEASAALGEQVAGLLDTESGVTGVTQGGLRAEMPCLGVIRRVGGGSLDPNAGELDLTVGWGHGGKGGVTMPGKGRIEARAYTPAEREAIAKGAETLGLSLDQALACLGEDTRDVYLNGVAYWCNVPVRVWDYYIGGYQVVKKWLSYRETKLLGRGLKPDEAKYVTEMVRRLAALRLLEPALDANYRDVKKNTYQFPTAAKTKGKRKISAK